MAILRHLGPARISFRDMISTLGIGLALSMISVMCNTSATGPFVFVKSIELANAVRFKVTRKTSALPNDVSHRCRMWSENMTLKRGMFLVQGCHQASQDLYPD